MIFAAWNLKHASASLDLIDPRGSQLRWIYDTAVYLLLDSWTLIRFRPIRKAFKFGPPQGKTTPHIDLAWANTWVTWVIKVFTQWFKRKLFGAYMLQAILLPLLFNWPGKTLHIGDWRLPKVWSPRSWERMIDHTALGHIILAISCHSNSDDHEASTPLQSSAAPGPPSQRPLDQTRSMTWVTGRVC